MRMKYITVSIFLLLILYIQKSDAQPYFYFNYDYYKSNDTVETIKFWRFNLQTGMKDLFYIDTLGGDISWDPTQTWIFIEGSRGEYSVGSYDSTFYSILAINASNLSIFHLFPDQHSALSNNKLQSFVNECYCWQWIRRNAGSRFFDGITYNPIKNVFYVTWVTDFYQADSVGEWSNFIKYLRTAIYDASTFAFIDSLSIAPGWLNCVTSISDDGNYLYVENWGYQQAKAIGRYSLLTKQLVINRNLSDIYIPGGYDVEDSKKGNFLLSFLYPRQQMEDKKFAVYNIDRDTVYGLIPFPIASHEHLSSDGKYVIIEETPVRPDDATSTSDNRFLHPGRISVFNGITGRLIQKLTLPPDGKVLVFDNYPNMMYYYLASEERSINIDLSKLGVSIISLNPVNAYANSAPFTLTVNGKHFVSGSMVNWNGTAKITTFISDTILQASILASDVAVIDSPSVTVMNPDSSESNSIRFYVTQKPVISGCNVKLVNSTGEKLTGGTLQYYDASWKGAANNNDGTFFVNTTKTSLSLRMTYEYGTQTKSNVAVGYDTVAFQTVHTQVQLQNSGGALIDTGTVQYYAGAWRPFGTTTNGIASKELLPANYSFRMTYAYANKDKQQDIGTNPTVVFQTVNAAVQLQNNQGTLMDEGIVQYYSGAWRALGTTNNGTTNKELLPNTYSFRMTYAYASKDKQQDLSTNPTVVFQTVNAAVQLKNSLGNLIPAPSGDQGTVQYYSGVWRALGTTNNGTTNKELLPNTYTFRMTYEYVSLDKSQDLSTNNTVSFSTVLCTVKVTNSQNQPLDNAMASYYSGAWRQIGNTVNGQITKELLPANLSFRVKYGTQQKDKQQNLSTNNIVEFTLP
jgi:hypothetical protein